MKFILLHLAAVEKNNLHCGNARRYGNTGAYAGVTGSPTGSRLIQGLLH